MMIFTRCPQCGDEATHQTPDGTYWDSSAHFWRSLPLWIEEPRSHLPMSARAYATAIMCDLERAGMTIELRTAQGYTTQDAITVIVETAMETARKEARSWRSLIDAAFGGLWMRTIGRSKQRRGAAAS